MTDCASKTRRDATVPSIGSTEHAVFIRIHWSATVTLPDGLSRGEDQQRRANDVPGQEISF